MHKQPLLILVICFILGIIFQDLLVLRRAFVYSITGISIGVLTLLFFHSYFLHKTRAFLLGVLFFGTGIILHYYNTFSSEVPSFSGKKGVVTFKISRKLNSSEKYRKYEVTAQTGKQGFNSVFYIPKSAAELDFIHYYRAEAYITRPKPPSYDFQFNYAQYLKRRGIDCQIFFLKEISSIERTDLSLSEKIDQYRFNVLKSIDKTEMSTRTKEFLKGIILADRTEIETDTLDDFNRSGLIHFLAISGTHIVVIFGMFYFVLIRFAPLKFRKYAVVLSLCFIWLFAIFIGFGNSVLRSCIMLTVYFIFILLQRKPDLLHSLALSAFIILIIDTRQIFDVGFQLSFLAVLGIFWLNQPLLKYFPKQDHYFKKLIFNTITISLSAQLATLPLVLYYFHQFSFISLIANFVVVPFSEIIIVFSFLMTAFIAFHIDFELMNVIYDFMIQILLRMIHWFAEIDVLFFDHIPMNKIEVLSAFLIIYLLRPVILKSDFRNSLRVMMGVLAFLILRTGYTIFENHKGEVLVQSFGRDTILSVKDGNRVCFWISDKQDQKKILHYIVKPYCSSRRVAYFEIKTLPSSVEKVVFRDKIYDLK
ncbi:ComEC/Rec2 family competence protein [Chryseobacterium sp. Tr-659]|uniref:ComEC/Rec2 family competence protein n=1 Tax=Chryseobacterium sp. Tr-659 TaxID=2608340 RepID=UPI001887AE7A|nr:ComEC/Rec2 family competence protein [Chryseobacterium sp. Tr-659]